MAGFTFDAVVSAQSTAYDKAHRRQPYNPASVLPSLRPKRPSISTVASHIKNVFRHSSSTTASKLRDPAPTPAPASSFFRLPLELREQIYGYLVGRNEVLHILMSEKKRPNRHFTVSYRRCKIGGNLSDCTSAGCRQFHDDANGIYYGPFDRIGGLLLTCRAISREAQHVLYHQNRFDFDLPHSFFLFTGTISIFSKDEIRSLSFDWHRINQHFGRPLFNSTISASSSAFDGDRITPSNSSPSSGPKTPGPSEYNSRSYVSVEPYANLTDHWIQWAKIWEMIERMEGVDEIRVRLVKLQPNRYKDMLRLDLLLPGASWNLKKRLDVFEIEMPPGASYTLELEKMEPKPYFRLVYYTPDLK